MTGMTLGPTNIPIVPLRLCLAKLSGPRSIQPHFPTPTPYAGVKQTVRARLLQIRVLQHIWTTLILPCFATSAVFHGGSLLELLQSPKTSSHFHLVFIPLQRESSSCPRRTLSRRMPPVLQTSRCPHRSSLLSPTQ